MLNRQQAARFRHAVAPRLTDEWQSLSDLWEQMRGAHGFASIRMTLINAARAGMVDMQQDGPHKKLYFRRSASTPQRVGVRSMQITLSYLCAGLDPHCQVSSVVHLDSRDDELDLPENWTHHPTRGYLCPLCTLHAKTARK